MIIHLLGIDHKFQFKPTAPWEEGGPIIDSTPPDLFERFLLKCVSKIHPDLMAEEASRPNPSAHIESVPFRVASRYKISHQFCDPDPMERLAMYEMADTSAEQDKRDGYPIRERFWLNKLSEKTEAHTILFVCGAYHIDSFCLKLQDASYKVNVVEHDWSPPTAG